MVLYFPMKIFSKIILAIGLFAICISGCKQDATLLQANNYLKIDTTSNSYDFYNVINKDFISDWHWGTQYQILNEFSFIFNSTSGNSPGGLIVSTCSVETIDSNTYIAINEEQEVDTICNYTISINDSTKKYYHENYDYKKKYDSTLELIILKSFYPKIFAYNDIIDENLNWRHGEFSFASSDQSYNYIMGTESNIHLGIWNGIDKRFIAIKTINGKDTYFGWIELGIYNYMGIKIYKYGFKRMYR